MVINVTHINVGHKTKIKVYKKQLGKYGSNYILQCFFFIIFFIIYIMILNISQSMKSTRLDCWKKTRSAISW